MSNSLIREPTRATIRQAAAELAAGNLVGIPTETVYGLAAAALNPDAVAKIYSAKGRPATNPLIVHVADVDAARQLIRMDEAWVDASLTIAARFWPGPLTIVAPRVAIVPDCVTAGLQTVAIRIPSHPVTQAILRECGFPVAAPSANVSDYVSPTTARHVAEGLGDKLAMVVDGGRCDHGVESTIVQLQPQGVKLLRPGSVSIEDLRRSFAKVEIAAQNSEFDADRAMTAPGMLAKHYSPATPLVLSRDFVRSGDEKVGHLAFRKPGRSDARIWYLSETGDLAEIAHNLFSMLREADQASCDVLAIDVCDETGLGVAIMDRVRRAIQ